MDGARVLLRLQPSVETIQLAMGNVANNNDANTNTGSSNRGNNNSLLREADELAESRRWTRDFALYIMFCRAMAEGDKMRAESCMNLLEQEAEDTLVKDEYSGDNLPK